MLKVCVKSSRSGRMERAGFLQPTHTDLCTCRLRVTRACRYLPGANKPTCAVASWHTASIIVIITTIITIIMTARGFANVSLSTNLCDGNIRNTCSFVLSRQIWSDVQDQTNCASTLSRRARWQVFTGKLHFFFVFIHPPFLMRDSHQYLELPWDLAIESVVGTPWGKRKSASWRRASEQSSDKKLRR